MADYTFHQVLVWETNPGGTVRLLRNGSVTVKAWPSGDVVDTVTSDASGQANFTTTDIGAITLTSPNGLQSAPIVAAELLATAANYVVSEDAAIASAMAGSGTASNAYLNSTFETVAGAPAKYVGKVKGLVPDDQTSGVKTANAAILAAALTPGSSAIIPRGNYYTNEVAIVGPVDLSGEDITTTLRNDTGSVFSVSGTQINVSTLTLRGQGGHTVRQAGAVDQGHWDRIKFFQASDGYSVWHNATAGMVDMRFTNFLSWHTQTATVPSWNLVAGGGTINNNVWSQFRAQFSGNYHFWVESTDVSTHHTNAWRDITWEVTTGGLIKLIGCRDYVIDNSTVWDLASGTGGLVTMKKHGIYADTNASNALCIGTIRNHRRLDSTCDAGIYDIKLPSGTARGAGTLIERCQNITSSNPLLVDLAGNDCLVINPGSSASTLTTYANTAAAQFINKSGISLPAGQTVQVGGATMVGFGLVAAVSGDPGSVAANSELDVALTVTGTLVGDACSVSTASALEAGLGIVGCWATANTVTFRLRNFTASAIDPSARTWRVRVWR